MKEKKDTKGRNNINKKDHQIKYTSIDQEKHSSSVENNQMQDSNKNVTKS